MYMYMHELGSVCKCVCGSEIECMYARELGEGCVCVCE